MEVFGFIGFHFKSAIDIGYGSGCGPAHHNIGPRKSVTFFIVDRAGPFAIGIIGVYPELFISSLHFLDDNDTLSVPDILSGFALPVAIIFNA